MDNVTSRPAFPDACVIKLDQTQFDFFRKSRLEIHSPDKILTVISKPLPHKTDADLVYQLWCQACLLEVLLDDVGDNIKLPQRATNCIAYVVDRIDMHLKRQKRI
jgi:hypothetical protein